MQRTTWKQIGLSALAAMLAVGCASATPQRAPGGAGATVQGSTTGDLDACAVALGNATTAAGTTGTTGMSTGFGGGTTGTHMIGANTGTAGTTGGRMEVTANGLMVGNVAIVALPEHDHMPMSPSTGGGGTTGTTATGPGTTGTTGTTTGSPVGSTGAPAGAPAGTTGAAGNTTALDRIRSSCRGVTEIRMVTDSTDRATLASITMAMRKGTPVTDYMTDIARIGRKATIAGGASGAGGGGTTGPAKGGATTGSPATGR
ncbi:MAG TPA: hypothetical protein VNT01_00190 [Symbiobacteriaceae bacterium]|nr:hypothetical protein [Symbiobacteriaceae bacterium]